MILRCALEFVELRVSTAANFFSVVIVDYGGLGVNISLWSNKLKCFELCVRQILELSGRECLPADRSVFAPLLAYSTVAVPCSYSTALPLSSLDNTAPCFVCSTLQKAPFYRMAGRFAASG